MKIIKPLTILLFLFTVTNVRSQEKPFKAGDVIIGPCMGMGGIMDVHFYSKMTPLYGIALDVALPIQMDSGFWGLGFIAGIRSVEDYHIYPISTPSHRYYYDRKWDYTSIATRITYRIDLLGVPDLDTYVGGIFSYNLVKITWEDNLYTDPKQFGYPYPLDFKSFYKLGIMLGARYDIIKQLGIFTEVSVGITNITFGIAAKL